MRTKQIIRVAIPLVIVILAFLVLGHLLKEITLANLKTELYAIGYKAIALSCFLCVLNYYVLSFYDTLGLKLLGYSLSYQYIMLTSFISYGLSQALGFPLLTGGAVRYRLYSARNVQIHDIAKVIIFAGAMFWSGLLVLLGILASLYGTLLGHALQLPPEIVHLCGGLLLALLAGTLILAKKRSLKFTIKDITCTFPETKPMVYGVAVSIADWCLAAGVLYSVLPEPHSVPYVVLLGAFLFAQLAGVVSHVPGGVGVFESIMILVLSGSYRQEAILGALLIYRLIYYMAPLLIALVLLMAYEIHSTGKFILSLPEQARDILVLIRSFVPTALSFLIFAAGACLICTGAVPADEGRMNIVASITPSGIVHISHLLGSIIGVFLIILSWSTARRRREAYALVIACLALGGVTSLIKRGGFEEALLTFCILTITILSRKEFWRKGRLLIRPSLEQFLGLLLVIIASCWIGFLSYTDTPYSNELWWHFALEDEAPRFLRTMVITMLFLFTYGFYLLLRTHTPKLQLPSREDVENLFQIVFDCGVVDGYLALMGDKYIFTVPDVKGFIMYQVVGRNWIVMGEPIAKDDADRQSLIWAFREWSDSFDGICSFYEVSPKHLPTSLDAGLSPLRIGEYAIVDLTDFSIAGGKGKGFRSTINKFEKESYTFEIVPPEHSSSIMTELKEISDEWLTEIGGKEKGFSLGFFDEGYLSHFHIAIVRHQGKILAFANIWITGLKDEISIDLMRHRFPPPNGLMDYLFLNLMIWAKSQGYHSFSLGMAPLSGFEVRRTSKVWNKVAAHVYEYGDRFYHFSGLRNYKEKLHPQWEPRYIMSSSALAFPKVLSSVTKLISRKT